jgi:hypothetical protein
VTPAGIVALALAAAGWASAVRAQQASEPVMRRFAVTVNMDFYNTYAHSSVEQALRSGGMGDVFPGGCIFGFCSPPVRHPLSDDGRRVATVTASYRLTRLLEVRAQYSNADLGSTEGYHADSTGYFGTFLTVAQRMQTFAVLAAVRGTDNVWLAAGPSLNHATIADVSSDPASRTSSSAVAPGAVIGAGITTGSRSLVFAELRGEYRLVLPLRLGPIGWPGSGGTLAPLPRSRMSFSYGLIALGGGVRL